MWSVGCILAELMQGKALFQERCEINMIKAIYKVSQWCAITTFYIVFVTQI